MLPGFKIALSFNAAFSVPPEDAYLSALGFMYDLAFAGWEGTIPSGFEAFTKEVNAVKVAFGSLAQPGDQYQLQNKHVALGLLRMLNWLAERDYFCFTRASLSVYRHQVGQMAIGRRAPETLAGLNVVNVTQTASGSLPSPIKGRGLTAKGKIVDPEDSDFVITYEMVGKSISCQALFNTALNAMAWSAVLDNDEECTNFAGVSPSGEVTYQINSSPRGTKRLLLTFILVRTALKLLPERLYEAGICGEVNFHFIYEGEKLGGGSILISDFQNRDRVAVR